MIYKAIYIVYIHDLFALCIALHDIYTLVYTLMYAVVQCSYVHPYVSWCTMLVYVAFHIREDT